MEASAQGNLRCNVDAGLCEKRRVATLAAIIRNRNSNLVVGNMRKIPCNSSLVVEAMAIREGILLAHSCQCPVIVMELDCLQVIKACRNNSLTLEMATVVENIMAMSKWFSSYALLWTPREGNMLAHHRA